jgi:FAD/FMN-containing dehydrogenase
MVCYGKRQAACRWRPGGFSIVDDHPDLCYGVLGSRAYVGFLGSADPADVAAAYPPDTYRRLAAVKRRYDPANVFRRTHNILPGRS